jgi:hypothetical protein
MSKVNIYISHDPADRKQLEALLEWLFPIQDEVNIWHAIPPENLPQMPLPWRILFFWHRPPDYVGAYKRVLEQRKLRAHLYFFLASPAALESTVLQADIAVAKERATQGDWRSPRLFRISAAACKWEKYPDWKALATLGIETPLNRAGKMEWIALSEAVNYHVRFIEPILRETGFYKGRPVIEDETNSTAQDRIPLPDLNEDPDAVTFVAPSAGYPPAWAGWALIAVLLLIGGRSLTSERERIGADLHLKARPASERPIEYPRQFKYVPPPDSTVVFPE